MEGLLGHTTLIGLGTSFVDPVGDEGGETHDAEDDDVGDGNIFHDVVNRMPLPQQLITRLPREI